MKPGSRAVSWTGSFREVFRELSLPIVKDFFRLFHIKSRLELSKAKLSCLSNPF